jgi:hypothetical protein
VSKFNRNDIRTATFSPVRSEYEEFARTHQGGQGYVRDAKSELFLQAVTNFVGEDTFYEQAKQRDDRYSALIHQVALEDPKWGFEFLRWLRQEANMRSASIVGAVEFVKARLDAGAPFTPAFEFNSTDVNRAAIRIVLQRADEPGELLAYWASKYGKAFPKPLKRGVADAVQRLYNEYALLKYDTDSKGYRFGDVLDLVHATPADGKAWQGDLFKHAIDRRHNRTIDMIDLSKTTGLDMIVANHNLRVLTRQRDDYSVLLNSDHLKAAGMTWEDALSLAGSKVDKAKLWEALIPTMGYMALLRNLRNFDEAGVSDKAAQAVCTRLSSPSQVAKSRQLPMRFLSAYKAAPSLRWAYALEQALNLSLANIPQVKGNTLILVDTSGSMDSRFSKDGTLMRWDAAALFGIALASRCENADVVSFSSSYYGADRATKVFPTKDGESVLKSLDRWMNEGYFLNGGTDTEGAVRKHLRINYHDRLVILTDEQASYGDVGSAIPAKTPSYTWNLAGYQYGHAPSGGENRHTFGGLTDKGFGMINLLESGRNGNWPWLSE